MNRYISGGVATVLLTLLSVFLIGAQGTCSALINEALTSMDDNCQGLERNDACYGFNLVQAAFLDEVEDDFFTSPADIADVLDLETIATAALDEDTDTWGVAVMNVQANLPNTLPGQNVTFVLMGDTEVENAVAPDEIFTPSDGMDVTIVPAAGANVRSGPGLNYNVIGGARPDVVLQADGQSEDGEWLRVAYDDRPAWINRVVIEEDNAFDELPVLSPELRTSMQAFYLRTGLGQPDCEGVPEDILVVQGPNGIDIEIEVNGAQVTIGSSIGLRTVEVNGEVFLELIVFSGSAEIDGVRVPVGYSTLMCLSEPDNRGLDGEDNDRIVSCAPSPPQPVDDFGDTWCHLEQVPASLLNYQIDILCPGETPPWQVESATTTTGSSSGSTTTITSETDTVDCSSFAIQGPTSGITPRPTTFTWTQAPGATRYEIVFYDFTGGFAYSEFTPTTSIELTVGQIPTGSAMQWEVRAYEGNTYACVTNRTPVIERLPDPGSETSSSNDDNDDNNDDNGYFAVAAVNCVTGGSVARATLVWNNLPDGEGISAYYDLDFGGSTATSISSSESGRFSFSVNSGYGEGYIHVSTTFGFSADLLCGDIPG